MNKQPKSLAVVDQSFDEIEMDPLEDLTDQLIEVDEAAEDVVEWAIQVDGHKAASLEASASESMITREPVEAEASIQARKLDGSPLRNFPELPAERPSEQLIDKKWRLDKQPGQSAQSSSKLETIEAATNFKSEKPKQSQETSTVNVR